MHFQGKIKIPNSGVSPEYPKKQNTPVRDETQRGVEKEFIMNSGC